MNRNRRRGSILAVAILTTMATLALAPGVGATSPARNGLIAFQAETDHGLQIFTVRAERQAAAPDHPCRRRCCGAGLVAGRPPDRLLTQRVFGGRHGRRWGQPRVLASDPDLCQGDPSYTPDGSRLVYVRFDPALDVEEIWSMKVDGSDKRFVTGAGGPDPNVSPDGQKISFKGPSGRRPVRREHRRQRGRPDLPVDLGHVQARLGAGRPAHRRQRQLGTRPRRSGQRRDRPARRHATGAT